MEIKVGSGSKYIVNTIVCKHLLAVLAYKNDVKLKEKLGRLLLRYFLSAEYSILLLLLVTAGGFLYELTKLFFRLNLADAVGG